MALYPRQEAECLKGALPIVRKRLSDLHQDPANARTHDEKNLASIKGSLQDFGYVEPIVVQKATGRIIGGNARYGVLRELGADEVDVVELDVDDITAVRLAIALNRTGELAGWDAGTLLEYIHNDPEYDWGRVGFLREDLELLAMQEPLVDVEEQPVPPLPAEPVSRVGDVWLLGAMASCPKCGRRTRV